MPMQTKGHGGLGSRRALSYLAASTIQPDLFGPPFKTRVSRHTESDRIYEAVLKLRRCGLKVVRQGRHHVVAGDIRLTDNQLVFFAEKFRRRTS